MTASSEPAWRGWLVPGGALVLAALLLALTLQKPPEPNPTQPLASPTITVVEGHEVETDEGTVSFEFDGAAIIVQLHRDGSASDLALIELPFLSTAPPGGTPMPTGSAAFALVCGTPGQPLERRYVVGHMDRVPVEYSGPDAVGQAAADGLFLFALSPESPAADIRIKGPDGSAVGYGADAFEQALTEGVEQPSGCFLLG